VARAVAMLGLKYAVVTSVTRDDLPDGGSSAFAEVIRSVRRFSPETVVEVLVPDFRGMGSSVAEVTSASPGVFGHNIETVRRLYPAVRMGAGYDRSLGLLKSAKSCAPHIPVKSGLMLGMGETDEEVIGTIHDIRRAGCDMLTIGQYMRPSKENLPVRRFYGMLEFDRYRAIALEAGFAAVKSGPFVRSSYFAEESYNNIKGGLS
jgi:lipoic acid synthetase